MKTWAEEQPIPHSLNTIFSRIEEGGRELLRYLAWTAGGENSRAHHDSVAAYLNLPPIDWAQVDADRARIAEWKANMPRAFTPEPGETAYGIVVTTLSWDSHDQDWYSLRGQAWYSVTGDEHHPALYRTLDEARYACPEDSHATLHAPRIYPLAEHNTVVAV